MKPMKRSAPVNERPDFIVKSAPFRFRTFHGFEKGKYGSREQMFTIDSIVVIPMPFFAFPARADATMASFDREA